MIPARSFWRQIPSFLLGLVIVWQLLFLLAANFFGLLKQGKELPKTIKVIGRVTRGWSQLTNQPQDWSLFAPDVSHEFVFVAVQLKWTGRPPALLLSDNEPPDLLHYCRFGNFRLRRYEDHLVLVLPILGGRATEEEALHWIEPIEEKVRRDGMAMHAYLRWRLQTYQGDRPAEAPPEEVTLIVRQYQAPFPGSEPWHLLGPEERPLARWRPGVSRPGCLPVEMYHPLAERFESVRSLEWASHE